ncbi:response regulator transcription factor [Pontibacter anaerobius]|uniref:Response regulator transcription factor n=1 Tax=Pontibacter anaerobius TaxID=2993940 RepID=A0ABT3RGM6_9BACT|nr:response regulator transcription factor [Pontibacter anaerobius]MCX2740779.1 response regulator transcription factor [Pontibacter anaerobius]
MTENSTIRLIVTDDHKIVREGIRSLLEQDDQIEVVGEAANGQELLQLLEYTDADVVLMDVKMPVMDGFEAINSIKANYPDIKVIVLTMLEDADTLHRLMKSGATGYLLKDTGRDELCTAIKLTSKGTPFICSGMSIKMLQKAMRLPEQNGADVADSKILSKRELEVLLLISEGFTNAEIAEKLFTSKRTIETHRQNILEKTQTRNTPNLIKYAIQHNLIELDS